MPDKSTEKDPSEMSLPEWLEYRITSERQRQVTWKTISHRLGISLATLWRLRKRFNLK